jgi:general secretion pathway protein D
MNRTMKVRVKRPGCDPRSARDRLPAARRVAARCALCSCLVLLAGCAATDLGQMAEAETALLRSKAAGAGKGIDAYEPEPAPALAEPDAEEEPLSTSAADLAVRRRAEPVYYRGNDTQVRLPQPQAVVKFIGDDVSLNFEQAPLDEITHAILGDILQLDYLVDRPLEGKVTLRTRTPIPRDELLVVLESLLKAHSVLMIRGKDGRYLVTGSQQAMSIRPRVGSADDAAAGFSNMIVPLEYISATAMAEILEPLAEPSAFVRVDNTRNLLMLAGTRAQLSGWLEVITTFDVDMLSGMSVGLFPLENSSVEETVGAVNSLLKAAGGEAGDISGIVRVLPMERLNSVLVISPRATYLDRVGEWVERLDVNPDARFARRLFVHPVQNTTATRLASLLNTIYAGSAAGTGATGAAGSAAGDSSAVAPGLSPESIGGGGSRGGVGAGGGSRMQTGGVNSGRGARAASAAMSASTFGASGAEEMGPLDDVRVVADDENNALMIYANGKQYDIIKNGTQATGRRGHAGDHRSQHHGGAAHG